MRLMNVTIQPGPHTFRGDTDQASNTHCWQFTAFEQTPDGPRRYITQAPRSLLDGPQHVFFTIHILSPLDS
jgi:hypothetical protein